MFILEVGRGWPTSRWPLNGIFELDQTRALRDYGHRTVYGILDLRSIRRLRRFGLYRKTEEGICTYQFHFPLGAIRGLDVIIGRWGFRRLLKRLIREMGRPDVIHVHFYDLAACVAPVARELGIPFVVTEHSSRTNTRNMTEYNRRVQREGYEGASAVIAVSSALKNNIMANTGVDCQVVPNILSVPDPGPHTRVPGENGIRFLAAASFRHIKGYDVLLDAFAQAARELPEARLHLMGEGPERESLCEQIRRLELSDRVSMSGSYHREDFCRELSQSDVYVLASRGETFGLTYVEALSCGVPVIATRCGGPEDFVDESNGLLVDVDDTRGLAEAMIRMADSLGEYDRRAISVQTRERFSAQRIAARLTEIFTRAIGDTERGKND